MKKPLRRPSGGEISAARNSAEITRRQFLGRAAGAAGALALFSIVPRRVLGGAGYTPPSEEITKAVIGVGGMGMGHLGLGESRLLAVCDVDSKHLENALKQAGKDVQGYRDFREVLARPDIDLIHIATPPHWHALMAIMAARAGKDIWCEKPMTRTIAEGRKVVEAVQQYGRIFRLNTWFRFEGEFYGFGTPVRPIKKIVDSGELGWPLKVVVGPATGFDWKHNWMGRTHLPPEPVPAELDYDLWLGPAPFKPYHPHRVHQTFRGYWDYDGGGLGDMGQHYLDPVQYFLGKDDTSPVEVEADTPLQHPDAVREWRRIHVRYADGCEIILDGDGSLTGVPYIEGPKGKLFPGMRSDLPGLQRLLASLPEPEPQPPNFIEAVRQRRQFPLNEANGHRSTTVVNLCKIAVRLGRTLRFDPEKEVFIGDEAANRLLDEPMRAPWHL